MFKHDIDRIYFLYLKPDFVSLAQHLLEAAMLTFLRHTQGNNPDGKVYRNNIGLLHGENVKLHI